jgi:hypothetical protein
MSPGLGPPPCPFAAPAAPSSAGAAAARASAPPAPPLDPAVEGAAGLAPRAPPPALSAVPDVSGGVAGACGAGLAAAWAPARPCGAAAAGGVGPARGVPAGRGAGEPPLALAPCCARVCASPGPCCTHRHTLVAGRPWRPRRCLRSSGCGHRRHSGWQGLQHRSRTSCQKPGLHSAGRCTDNMEAHRRRAIAGGGTHAAVAARARAAGARPHRAVGGRGGRRRAARVAGRPRSEVPGEGGVLKPLRVRDSVERSNRAPGRQSWPGAASESGQRKQALKRGQAGRTAAARRRTHSQSMSCPRFSSRNSTATVTMRHNALLRQGARSCQAAGARPVRPVAETASSWQHADRRPVTHIDGVEAFGGCTLSVHTGDRRGPCATRARACLTRQTGVLGGRPSAGSSSCADASAAPRAPPPASAPCQICTALPARSRRASAHAARSRRDQHRHVQRAAQGTMTMQLQRRPSRHSSPDQSYTRTR